MMAICTCFGVPQRFSDFFAALYHFFFSSKMAQMFSTFCGGAVAQAAIMKSKTTTTGGEARLKQILRVLLENPCMYMNSIVKRLAQGL